MRETLSRPAAFIARNAGYDPDTIVGKLLSAPDGIGFDAASGEMTDMILAGIVDPVRVTYTALRNAASVATLVLTTNTLVADITEYVDRTAGPALGGGAESSAAHDYRDPSTDVARAAGRSAWTARAGPPRCSTSPDLERAGDYGSKGN